MQRALVLVIMCALGACAQLSDRHARIQWDPTTGEIDCPVKGPIGTTAATVILGLIAADAFYTSRHPGVQTYDDHGYPNNVTFSPEFDRGVGYFAAGAGAITALVSVLEWSGYARCHRLDSQVRALVLAHDCATVVRLDAELAVLDSDMSVAVRATMPAVAACVSATTTKP